jgi:hypothetical protein
MCAEDMLRKTAAFPENSSVRLVLCLVFHVRFFGSCPDRMRMESNSCHSDDQIASFEVELEFGMAVVALHQKSLIFAYLQADLAILIFITVIIRGLSATEATHRGEGGKNRRG